MVDLTIHPECPQWMRRVRQQPEGVLFGHAQGEWRCKTRHELGLDTSRPIVATGHQTMLWHPGILAKYLVIDGFARRHDLATANLVVDQHVGDFGAFDVPVQRGGHGLAVRSIQMSDQRPDVPMGLHAPFTPGPPPTQWRYALPSVRDGVERIIETVSRHDGAPDAAQQMARALADLMSRWVRPLTDVTATDLMATSLARAFMQCMVDDPRECALAYNRALAQVPGARIRPLLIRDDYIELPVWRIRRDDRRMHGYDNDVEARLEDPEAPPLLPRALFMTALVRLGMCDLFVHGTGGARYDRAMEIWIRQWLGVEASPIAIATATLRLPLGPDPSDRVDLDQARRDLRRLRHDPESIDRDGIGARKRELLAEVNRHPRRSLARRRAFVAMHAELTRLRSAMADRARDITTRYETARRQTDDAPIANRRTWPFSLYDETLLDELAEACRHQFCIAGG